MASIELKKHSVYFLELPVQEVTKKGETGRPVTVASTEMYGAHPCVVTAVAEDNGSAVVVPLTSAQDSNGGEKWRVIKKSWLRLVHEGRPAYAQTEQIRCADRARFLRECEPLSEYDVNQLELKLRFLFNLQ